MIEKEKNRYYPRVFYKMCSIGNHFVLQIGDVFPSDAFIQKISRRSRVVGFDQLVFLYYNQKTLDIHFWNNDGSYAQACGNGVRCAVYFLMRRGDILPDQFIEFHGKKNLWRGVYESTTRQVLVEQGPVHLYALRQESGDLSAQEAFSFADIGEGIPVDSGNPHLVILTQNCPKMMRALHGKTLSQYPAFPHQVNVSFVKFLPSQSLHDIKKAEIATWEKGTGPTDGCGTASCAVAAVLHEKTGAEKVELTSPGGLIEVQRSEAGVFSHRAPAEMVFQATFDKDFAPFDFLTDKEGHCL